MNLRNIFYLLGWLVSVFGVFMFIPVLVSNNPSFQAHFIQSAFVTMFSGALFLLVNRTHSRTLSHRDGFLLTFLVWLLLSFFGALPFYLNNIGGSIVGALFEATSGLTTTGATVLSGLDTMDRSILLWRAMLQWLGGMGIIVLAVAILPFLGVGGMQLYKSEVAGVVKNKLHPRLQDTAKALWALYIILTLACGLCYLWAGMNWFDALCHAMTTIATGGYSTRDASIGHFNSGWVELVAMVFMLLGAVNFSLHFTFFTGRRIGTYVQNTEWRAFAASLAVVICANLLILMAHGYALEDIFRESLFNTIAVVTTTGYGTTDYGAWPFAAQVLLFFVMFSGGCSGSTTGGVKVMRLLMLTKQAQRELVRLLHPRSVIHVKVDGEPVSEKIVEAVWSFIALYALSFIIIAFAISLYGFDFFTSFAAAGATLTGLGPGFGAVGPASTYAFMPDGAKLILCFSMLLGRLEVFTILVILSPAFWRR